MGRVSRYKKVKSIDPFAKNPTWNSELGDTSCATLRRVKRRSKTALKLKEQKIKKLQKRGKTNATDGKRKKGGSNGWGDEDGYDLPPDGEDEFDMADLMGSVKKKSVKTNDMLEPKDKIPTISAPSLGEEKWTRRVESVDLRGVSMSSNTSRSATNLTSGSQKSKTNGKKSSTSNMNDPNSLIITAKTPTKDIIAACSNPKAKKANNTKNAVTTSSPTSMTKQEKRKAFLEQKKSKKRNRSSVLDEDDDNMVYNGVRSVSGTKAAPVVARNAIGDQVERPPIFSSLPRGASKNEKSKTIKNSSNGEEGEDEKAQRIRKEQLALEAMRENVMKQYAILRESRRGGR